MKKKAIWMISIVTVAMLGVSVPVMAREFITSDEALSLQTTADGWEETEDKSGRMTLKKGDSIITVMHCGNGEELPERAVAEGAYAGVYEASVSTKNEVILITGSVTDMKDFEEMRETVESLKILKYDTRKAVEKESVQEEENLVKPQTSIGEDPQTEDVFEIEECSFANWVVSDSLNVRASYSTEAQILDTIYYAEGVTVTGIVKENGTDTGWRRISYSRGEGYVSGDYISLNAPTAEQSGIVLTEEQKTLYTQDGNSATYINRAEDGRWYDGSGREYVEAGGSWQCVSSGETWMEEIPESTVEEHVEENAEETPEESETQEAVQEAAESAETDS